MSSRLLALALHSNIDDPRLKLLLVALADSANEGGMSEPYSAEDLMRVVGRKRSSIFNYLKKAEDLNLLTRIPQFNNNQQDSNRYQLHSNAWPTYANSTSDAVQHAGRRHTLTPSNMTGLLLN